MENISVNLEIKELLVVTNNHLVNGFMTRNYFKEVDNILRLTRK